MLNVAKISCTHFTRLINTLFLVGKMLKAQGSIQISLGQQKQQTNNFDDATPSSCCSIGKSLAKHGHENCNWSTQLISGITKIDQKFQTKSKTGSKPTDKLINLRLLTKCGDHYRNFFNKCCKQEKTDNRRYIRDLRARLSRLMGEVGKVKSKLRSRKQYAKEQLHFYWA